MPIHAHINFPAVVAKLDLVHARSHETNSSIPVFSNVFWRQNIPWVESASFISNQDRQGVIGFAGVADVDLP
jgi:hypothetical protein